MTSPSLTLKMILLGSDTTASAALGSLASKASSLPAQLSGPLSKMGSLIGGEVGELVQKISTGLDQIGEDGSGLGTKFAAGGAALAGIGAAGALIGSKDKASLSQLQQAITDSGGAYSDYQDQIDKTVKQQENFGNSATSTQNALATLTEATGDPTKAIANMGLAANLAAAKHEDLGSAASQLAKVIDGTGTKTLKQYGITTTDMTLATQQLADKLKGQASASVDSWGGKLDVLKTKVSDQVAVMGQRFGPALTAAGTGIAAMGTVTQFLAARQAAAAATQAAAAAATEAATVVDAENAVATEGQTVAVEGQSVATKIAAAAQWLFNAAMDANPLVLLVIAIAAVIAGIVYLATQTQFFQDLWKTVWGAIQAVINVVWDWIKANWPLLLGILTGPIGLAVGEIIQHWSAVKDGFTDVKNWISSEVGAIVGFFTGMGGKIASAASGMFDGVKNAFKAAINWIIGKWNGLHFTVGGGSFLGVSLPSATLGVPQIPYLAMGGDITAAGRVVVGDAGPEMLDLPKGARVTPLNKAAGAGQFGQPIELNVQTLLDGKVIASSVVRTSNSGNPLNIKIAGVNG